MEVEWLDRKIYFENLDIGETFVRNNLPYIKIDQDRYTGVNAVSLLTGAVEHFENSNLVTEAHFKLVEI